MNLIPPTPLLSRCFPPVGSDLRYHQCSEATSCDCKSTADEDVDSNLPTLMSKKRNSIDLSRYLLSSFATGGLCLALFVLLCVYFLIGDGLSSKQSKGTWEISISYSPHARVTHGLFAAGDWLMFNIGGVAQTLTLTLTLKHRTMSVVMSPLKYFVTEAA